MAKRSPKDQTKHNAKVRQIANQLKKEGWQVEADHIPGFDNPTSIGKENRIPDIVARKRGAERIIEVETSDTMEKDKKQQETFRRSAAQKKRTSFHIEEV